MSERDDGDEYLDRDRHHDHNHDHDYAVVIRPYARVRVEADTRDGGLEALSAGIEYDRNGLGTTEDATNAATATGGGRPGIEWRDLSFDLYRNGERVLGGGTGDVDLDTSEVLGYVDDLAVALSRLSRRLR
jgi:hypothetical protein